MLRKSFLAVLCLSWLGPACSVFAGRDPALIGWWKLDDGAGAVAVESSGKGVNGTLFGNPVWGKQGMIGGCLLFDGTDDYVFIDAHLQVPAYTMAVWFRDDQAGQRDIISVYTVGVLHGVLLEVAADGRLRFVHRCPVGTGTGADLYSTASYSDGAWHHAALVKSATEKILYVDGKEVAKMADTTAFGASDVFGVALGCLDNERGLARMFLGALDDVQIYDRALSALEIQKIMQGLSDKALAENVSPQDGATDVPRDAALNWTAGRFPATHDVYLGTAFADVNTASRTGAKGLLASQGQTATTFDPPGLLAYGQTYYWRIDEVNSSPDQTIYKGNVWSFTSEPYGYPVKPVRATASSYQAGMGPENTINGSGLSPSGLHDTAPTTMWMSAGAPPNWIQYEFDKVYKLHQLLVWNANQVIESMLGFGAKKVTIETSTDGTKWALLANVPEFARAPGTPDYAANTTVNFGGVEAKFVKLTVNANWGGLAPQTGLAEVRFTYVPVQARAPQPAAAATGVSIDTDLNWRPGREAASHSVSFGTDPNALGTAKKVTDDSFDPGALNFGTKYYWKVDEVNTVTYPGEVWSFTTQEFAAIDDFESYTDKAGEEVFTAWVDGVSDGLSNSVVGLATAVKGTFCDTTIFHGGKMSMPFEYNNVKTPFYSQAERSFDKAQDWTTNGATHLGLWVRGQPAAFVDKGNGAFTIGASGHDIWDAADDFRFVCKQLNGDGSIVVKVDSLVNTNGWAKAGVMIRQNLTDGSPMVDNVISASNGVGLQYRLTGGTNASSTNAPNTTGIAAPQWVKLTRKGDVFTAQYSADGKTWLDVKNPALTGTPVSITVNMPSNVYIGLCVSSHDAALTTTAEFSGVATTGNVSGVWQQAWIGDDVDRTNGPGGLYVTVKDSAGKAATVSYPGGANVNAWTQWKIPLTDLTAAGVKTTSIKKMAISVGDPAKPTAGGAGKINIDDIGYGRPAQ